MNLASLGPLRIACATKRITPWCVPRSALALEMTALDAATGLQRCGQAAQATMCDILRHEEQTTAVIKFRLKYLKQSEAAANLISTLDAVKSRT